MNVLLFQGFCCCVHSCSFLICHCTFMFGSFNLVLTVLKLWIMPEPVYLAFWTWWEATTLLLSKPLPKWGCEFCILQLLLSLVFRILTIKAVLKLCICILSVGTSLQLMTRYSCLVWNPIQQCSQLLQTTLWAQCMNRKPWRIAVTTWEKKPECSSC